MGKKKELLPEDTVIIWNKHPVGEYRKFFQQATGKKEIVTVCKDFQTWLFTQTGKTLKEALEEYYHPSEQKNMEQFLSERRFNIIKESDKVFIIAFDKAVNELGYDFGGVIGSGNFYGPFMIIYGKTGTKSRSCAARIYIKDTGAVGLRLFLNNINNHRSYIENAPSYIKDVFTGEHGKCKHCKGKLCKFKKIYTIAGCEFEKCNGLVFEFWQPDLEKLSAYVDLLKEFYPKKK